jgi:nucleotide-binding universal stress UspA family protein
MKTAIAIAEKNSAIKFKNVLFTTDFSEASTNALPYAAALAREFGGRVFVCYIVTPAALAIGAPEAAPYLYQAEMETAKKELAELVRSPWLDSVDPKPVMLSGIFGDELKNAIKANDVDLVVAGTHGRTGFRRLVLGSGAEEICRVSSRPVLTIGPDTPGCSNIDFKTILYPTDLSDESLQALPYATAIAQKYGSRLLFLHVLPRELGQNPDSPQLEEPLRRRMKQLVENSLGTIKTEFLIETGETVEMILTVAREQSADLIAMGIRNAFAPGVQLRSSISYQLLSAAHCPVLTYRSIHY